MKRAERRDAEGAEKNERRVHTEGAEEEHRGHRDEKDESAGTDDGKAGGQKPKRLA